ncbi:MAG: tetratricopeptide repeat protein [Pseudomonadota bacterium]
MASDTETKPLAGDGSEDSEDVVVSPEEAIKLAIGLHQQGAFDKAEYIYQRIIDHDPEQVDALQFLGVLRFTQGRLEEALDLLEKARALAPDDPGLMLNYGNVLLEAGRGDEVVDIYRRVLEIVPKDAGAWNNMGVLLRALGRTTLAEEAFRKSIEIDPDKAGPWHNLGNLLLSTGRVKESIDAALRSVTLLPESKVGRKLLGIAYAYLGETEKAKEVFRNWLDESPGDPTAVHHLAALEGRAPDRASDEYVEHVFDSFATSFDARLESLEYRAPQVVHEALAKHVSADAPVAVLDVGCGTGLCGPLVRPLASRLVGIDLSAKMMERAKKRHAYDALEKAEFISYLRDLEGTYGAIIAADALCYVGKMEDFSKFSLTALDPGGVLIATFEADQDGEDVALQHTGRYTHGDDYLRNTFKAAGFVDVTCSSELLRYEQGDPVNGWLLTAKRPA